MTSITEMSETIGIMRMKEESTYKCRNYFENSSSKSQDVNVECRDKMVEWCYQVVEFCNFNREVVGISISYLDRFLCTSRGQMALENRKLFQLATMCALYMASKLFEPRGMSLKLLSTLSKGAYSEEEIAEMELTMLNALQWLVHPPTSVDFIKKFLSSISPFLQLETVSVVQEMSIAQTELTVRDYSFITTKQSCIAMACIMNSLHSIDGISEALQTHVLSKISQISGIKLESRDISDARKTLQQSWEISGRPSVMKILEAKQKTFGQDSDSSDRSTLSPVSVSRHFS